MPNHRRVTLPQKNNTSVRRAGYHNPAQVNLEAQGWQMRIGVVISFVLFASGPILAQTLLGVGALGGTIRDESGAVVADAKVSLTEESKGLFRESKSDRGGSFLFPAIIAGVYSIEVEKRGFSPRADKRLEDRNRGTGLCGDQLTARGTPNGSYRRGAHNNRTRRGNQLPRFGSGFRAGSGATAEWPQSAGIGGVGGRRTGTQPPQVSVFQQRGADLSARLFYPQRSPTR